MLLVALTVLYFFLAKRDAAAIRGEVEIGDAEFRRPGEPGYTL